MSLVSGPSVPKPITGSNEMPTPKEIVEAFDLLFSRGIFEDVENMVTFFLQMDKISKMVGKIPEKDIAQLDMVNGVANNDLQKGSGGAATSDYLLGMLIMVGPVSIFWGGLVGLIAKFMGTRHGLGIGVIAGGAVATFLSMIYFAVANKSKFSYLDTDVSDSKVKDGEKVIADILSRWVEVCRILNENSIEVSDLNRVVLDYAKASKVQYKLGFPFE